MDATSTIPTSNAQGREPGTSQASHEGTHVRTFKEMIPATFPTSDFEISIGGTEHRETFLAVRKSLPSRFERVMIFDADDTLWPDNKLYNEYMAELAAHICHHVPELTSEQVLARLDAVERQIFPVKGPGPYSFVEAVEQLWTGLEQQFGRSIPREKIIDKALPHLTGGPYEFEEGVHDVLTHFRESGHGIIAHTEGFLDIQLSKFHRSQMLPFFDAVSVVRKKCPETLKGAMRGLNATVGSFTMVGNSLNSDVRPALAAGIHAVQYINPHTWSVVNNAEIDPNSFRRIHSLRDLIG